MTNNKQTKFRHPLRLDPPIEYGKGDTLLDKLVAAFVVVVIIAAIIAGALGFVLAGCIFFGLAVIVGVGYSHVR